ncbi:cytosolic phospholipase A2 gamma-like [Alosa pseudoharengus]|uniref:cytosolic phospholipase A2 gamma-like n=1 Tax=Alosa pseudoharengus TaxID=34774 RepID=UPI003F8903DC
MSVVISQDISDPEKHFSKKRQSKIVEALKIHEILCPENDVPRVALLGSGGGQRAHIGFLGVIRQLGTEHLLGCMQYVAGVSGSTWCMSSLYQEPQWTQHAEEAANKALLSMSEQGEGVTFHDAVEWMKQRYEEGDFSLSDVWGVITCWIKGVSLETRPLMDDKDEKGASPYPLYSAIDKDHKEMWFEFSPHEVGFLEPGAYVKTSLLKRDFEGGKVKPHQPWQRKPMDMVQLQGICGCAMGDLQFIKDTIWHWIHSLSPVIKNARKDPDFTDKIDIVYILADLMENYSDPENSCSELERLKCLLGESYRDFSPTLQGVKLKSWRSQDRKKLVESITDELVASVDKWGPHPDQLLGINGIADVWWVMWHVMPKFFGWTFGTVANFLYKFQDDAIPKEMIQEEQMHLIDAGLYLNSPYPSALRTARDTDLIISFDFSDGDPFETLRVASDYAHKNSHPFPKGDFALDPGCPKSYYVFEERGKPTVIHIPLFNMDNCYDEESIEKERKEYRTFQMPYRDKTKINHLADLAAENVTMNRENILSEIKKAVQRRKHQK